MRAWTRWYCAALVVVLVAPGASAQITVSAAVSLKEVLTEIARDYERDSGWDVQLNFGATGRLLAQIRHRAPVDALIAASDEQMRQAEALHLVDPASRTVIASNRLVLIAPREAKVPVESFERLSDPAIKRLAIGEPRTVPAGQYARQVLRALDLEASLQGRIVHGGNVRQVLDYVERGEVDAGIVYLTDAKQAGDSVRIVAEAKANWHDPIRYVAATIRGSGRADEVGGFIRFLTGDAGQKILASHGFAPATEATTRKTENSSTKGTKGTNE